ncbi:lysine--tRNA ligase, partial [Candidatus Uhrbacteria bacterium]|nr:lysine--tRNA ligase [Candidatus Uhrbacteria bacterium]
HNALDQDMYLCISDEMYLKRLIVGGYERVYEIYKVFRNEGIDHDHNPEFTMLEAQMAYTDYREGMDLIEEVFESAAQQLHGSTNVQYQGTTLSFARPWKRMTMIESIVHALSVNPLEWRTLSQAKTEAAQLLPTGRVRDTLGTLTSIGEIIALVFEECVEATLQQPTIIYDYPTEVSPLAKKCPEDSRFTQRFEYFVMGSELGNNYTELNDPEDLQKRFIEEKKREKAGFQEAHQTDRDYLEAIEHGFPPTCGLAIGIDRMAMMLTNAASIKEVIFFPTLKFPGTNRSESPTNISE